MSGVHLALLLLLDAALALALICHHPDGGDIQVTGGLDAQQAPDAVIGLLPPLANLLLALHLALSTTSCKHTGPLLQIPGLTPLELLPPHHTAINGCCSLTDHSTSSYGCNALLDPGAPCSNALLPACKKALCKLLQSYHGNQDADNQCNLPDWLVSSSSMLLWSSAAALYSPQVCCPLPLSFYLELDLCPPISQLGNT